ncbi:hypothetical protein SUGI_0770340 [Cryptomeria japonica]|nr:hypothetical protein SUGI_0770340 [Cryptomeria japonica]
MKRKSREEALLSSSYFLWTCSQGQISGRGEKQFLSRQQQSALLQQVDVIFLFKKKLVEWDVLLLGLFVGCSNTEKLRLLKFTCWVRLT